MYAIIRMVLEPKKSPIFRVFPPSEDRKMFSSKVKVLVSVFALFLFTGLVTAGCKQKSQHEWVNTSSMPGQTFTKYTNQSNAKQSNSTIVYLGSDSDSSNANFGPRDVSFEFKNLK